MPSISKQGKSSKSKYQSKVMDPVKFVELCWPDINLYDKQREILYSVRDNEETYVPAGNALGKDFVAALAVLWFFVSRRPAKVVTTSVKGDQLNDVLWAEIRRFIDTSRYRLPILFNHLHIRQLRSDGTLEPRSSLTGQVAKQGESLLGRHIEVGLDGIPRTMVMIDEASGVANQTYESADTWAHRKLITGNPYPTTNFFRVAVQLGDLKSPVGDHLRQKIIKIRAEDSPNVRLAQAQERSGKKPTGETLVPGVIDYNTYLTRRKFWDKIRQCIGLDAEFYEGAEAFMFPPDWLNEAETYAAKKSRRTMKAQAIGVDPAEGGDNSAWSVVGYNGLIDLVSLKTPDTTEIISQTLALMNCYGVPAEKVFFDRGGGGKQHADRMRQRGYKVETVAFGEPVKGQLRRGTKPIDKRRLEEEERYVHKNRRAEMYDAVRQRLNPLNETPFALPSDLINAKRPDGGPSLREQLAPIPMQYDEEGRMFLPPKRKPANASRNTEIQTLEDLVGCSPDEADALALAVWGMDRKLTRPTAGAI